MSRDFLALGDGEGGGAEDGDDGVAGSLACGGVVCAGLNEEEGSGDASRVGDGVAALEADLGVVGADGGARAADGGDGSAAGVG